MLFRLQRKAVDVDTDRRDVGVVLVGLHFVEVASLTHLEPVVTVELEQGSHHGVLAGHTFHTGHGVARFQHGAVPPVGEVEGLLSLPWVHDGVIARHIGVTLDNPDEFLTGVIEVQLQLVGGAGDGFCTRELEGLDQVFVGDLGELTTFIRVQVDVVHVEGRSLEVGGGHAVTDGVVVGGDLGGDVPAQVAQVVELQVDTHFVVLEGDQGESQTRVAAEPELQRDVQGVRRGAVLGLVGGVGFTAGAVIVARFTTLDDEVGQHGDVTHHLGVTGLLTGFLGEFVPDVEPVAVVLVDALTTDFDFHGLDEVVANPVEPAELGTRAVRGLEGHLGQSGLEIHAVDQVTITLDGAGHALAEARRAVEGVFNGLHGEVGVTTVDHLEEGDLGVTGQVNILRAVCDELHQATTCHLLYTSAAENILGGAGLGGRLPGGFPYFAGDSVSKP